MTWTIYALREPDDGRIRYVGYTSLPIARRLASHLAAANKPFLPVQRWIKRLALNNQRPLIEPLETGNGEWSHREKWWIAHFRLLEPGLLNLADGGPAGAVIPPESRKRAGEKLKNRYFSPEHRARISAAKTGKPRGDAAIIAARCREMALRNIGKKMNLSDQERERRRRSGTEAAKNNFANNDYHSPIWRAAVSAGLKKSWAKRKVKAAGQ